MKFPYYIFVFLALLLPYSLFSQSYDKEIERQLTSKINRGVLANSDVNWKLKRNHRSKSSGLEHVYFHQMLNELPVFGTASSIHISSKGRDVIFHNRFVKNSLSKSRGVTSPRISSAQAVKNSAQHLNYIIKEDLQRLKQLDDQKNSFLYSSGGISEEDIPVSLGYWKNDEGLLLLSWKLSILEPSLENWWTVYVDAISGEVLDKVNNVVSCSFEGDHGHETSNAETSYIGPVSNPGENDLSGCTNCYEVLARPIESPYYGERSIVMDPAYPIASPYGWHDTNGFPGPESDLTIGNNTNTISRNYNHYAYQPDGGQTQSFINYSFSQTYNVSEPHLDASITNLFYWTNIAHDVLYVYGFDEAAGNFQKNNYGNGGRPGDPINAYGQGSAAQCTGIYGGGGVDGSAAYFMVGVCGEKDGDFDNIVTLHEYSHGIMARLAGSPGGGCLINDEQMVEGFADWYGLMLTMQSSHVGEDPRAIATYLRNHGPNGNGVRQYPYSTDMSINPHTYGDIENVSIPHGVGSVWAAALWEVTWVLIEEYGYDPNIYNFTGDLSQDAGNIMAMAIVTEAIKIVGCEAGFVDARDAVLRASLSIYGGENQCIMWEAFARRGLGVFATQGSPIYNNDGLENFDVPSREANLLLTYVRVCESNNVFTSQSGGLPFGGVYSGVGVTDDGNGATFSFDPVEAGVGFHTVSYTVADTTCSDASTDTATMEVYADTIAPDLICPETIEIRISSENNSYTLPDYSHILIANDNCTSSISITILQEPDVGSAVPVGDTEMTLTGVDAVGNESSCNFILRVTQLTPEVEDYVALFPSPASQEFSIVTTVEIRKLNVSVIDIHARLVIQKNYTNFGFEQTISVDHLSAGVYFVKIDDGTASNIKRLIKL